MTVYGYIRVSTKHQIDNTSFATQRKTIRGLAMTHDCDDEEIVWLEDPAVSAAKNFFAACDSTSCVRQRRHYHCSQPGQILAEPARFSQHNR